MVIKKYVWHESHRSKVDANVVGGAIDALGRRLGKGFEGVSPSDVVAEAESPESPLHSLFTWDDTEAAAKWRNHEARNILNSIRIVIEEAPKPKTIVGRVSVKTDDGERLYVPTSFAARNESLREQMIADALSGLKGWTRRYADLKGAEKAMALVGEAIEALEEQAAPRRKRRAQAPALAGAAQ